MLRYVFRGNAIVKANLSPLGCAGCGGLYSDPHSVCNFRAFGAFLHLFLALLLLLLQGRLLLQALAYSSWKGKCDGVSVERATLHLTRP